MHSSGVIQSYVLIQNFEIWYYFFWMLMNSVVARFLYALKELLLFRVSEFLGNSWWRKHTVL